MCCSAACSWGGSTPRSQEPSLVMPMGTTSYLSLSRLAMTDAAEASETSCSPERPPKMMPMRIFFFFSVISLSLSKAYLALFLYAYLLILLGGRGRQG